MCIKRGREAANEREWWSKDLCGLLHEGEQGDRFQERTQIRVVVVEGRVIGSNHFGCDCPMLETLYQAIFHDLSL